MFYYLSNSWNEESIIMNKLLILALFATVTISAYSYAGQGEEVLHPTKTVVMVFQAKMANPV